MIFVALEYAGPSLQHQQLSPRWTAGIRAAIEAVHGAGVLHGDLHLGNLVGTDPSDVKLIDFSNASISGHSLKAQAQEKERFLHRLAQVGLLAMLQHLFVSVFSQSATCAARLSIEHRYCQFCTRPANKIPSIC
jgi:serine/threonine protein kinase